MPKRSSRRLNLPHLCVLIVILAALLAAGCRAGSPPPTRAATLTVPVTLNPPTPTALPSATAAPSPTPPASATQAATLEPASPPPTLAGLGPNWTRLFPAGDTACAYGTPYSFWARAGASGKLLVFFEGGGACWDAGTCAHGSIFFDSTVSEDDSPTHFGGIFDLANPANPFRDWSMVYLAYCTGDVHWGSHTMTYTAAEGSSLVIHHNGFVNASAALAWAYAQFPAPATVFVTGCSAGSAGSAALAPYVIDHYSNAVVNQLGDSLALSVHRPIDLENSFRATDNFPPWIPALAALGPQQFSLARYYAAIAQYYPGHTFAEYNSLLDTIQSQFFFALGGRPGDFPAQLSASLREIHAAAPNFRSYTDGGTQHCLLPVEQFYTARTGGVPFSDWVAALADGQPVADVQCPECDTLP